MLKTVHPVSHKSDSLIKQTASTEQKSVRYLLANGCQQNKQNNETRQQQQTEEMRLLRPRKSARRIVTFCIHFWKHFWQYGPRRKQTKLMTEIFLTKTKRRSIIALRNQREVPFCEKAAANGQSSRLSRRWFFLSFFFFFLYSHTISMTAT